MIQKRELLNRLKRIKNELYTTPIFKSIVEIDNIYDQLEEKPQKNNFNKIKDTYTYMLEYFAKDTPDAQREKIYDNLRKNLLDIADYLQQYMHAYHTTNYQNIYSQYHQRINLIELLNNLETNSDEIDLIFSRIWLIDKFEITETKKIDEILKNKNINDNHKSLITSSLTMSLLRVFDVEKFNLLFNAYYSLNSESSIRALTGIILGIFIHEKRISLYPELLNKFTNLNNSEDDLKNIESIVLQLVKTKDTENIIREFNEDILPEMMKMKNDLPVKISNEINLDELSSENLMDDENPGWENYIDKNPEFFERMEKFTMRQFSGSDIFSATLGNLKNFSFFKKISNWFLPFSADNQEIKTGLEQSIKPELAEKFLTIFQKASYFCNSDKYSFCLHIPQIAGPMRNTAVNMIISEIEGAQEVISDEFEKTKNQDIVVRYVQDLYRFFNFNNNFSGYKNIFKLDIGLHKSDIFKNLNNYNQLVRSSAELLMSQKMSYYAALTFEKAIKNGLNEPEVYEKAGFSFQKTKNFENALLNYKKAEYFDRNKKWLYKKIGFTSLKMHNYKQALEYYKKAEIEDADDIATQSFIGRCHLELGNFADALKNFFKADFFKPDNVKIMRSISFCSYKVEKYEQAEKYALKCIEKEPHKFDFFLMGNISWLNKNKAEAIKFYTTSMSEFKTFLEFKTEFWEFKKFLLEHNISEFEYDLMVDYLQMKFYL